MKNQNNTLLAWFLSLIILTAGISYSADDTKDLSGIYYVYNNLDTVDFQKDRFVKAIVFKDKKGEVFKAIPIDLKMNLEQSKTKKDEHIEVHLLVNDTNTHAIEAVRVVEDLTGEERYRTGFKYKESNQITYYNKKGETLFALSDVAIMPLMISRNGKRIACERYGVHQPDYPISDTVDRSTLRDKLVILDDTGKSIYERSLEYELMHISPSGNWLVVDDMTDYFTVVNITTEKETIVYFTDISKQEIFPLKGITDTGDIFGATVIYNPWKKNHRAIK